MFKEEFITRHADILGGDALNKEITIVGAGAIGSFTTLALAKMGFQDITVYDFDTIEPENMGNQFFPVECIGQSKVQALKGMVKAFTGIEIKAAEQKLDPQSGSIPGDYLISAVDSMEVRKFLYEDLCTTRWLIDPRMGAEYATLYTLDMQKGNFKDYEKTLYSDEDAVRERCTAKTTIYTVLMIAGQIVKAVKDTATGSEYMKVMDWNIAGNEMVAFSSEGRKL